MWASPSLTPESCGFRSRLAPEHHGALNAKPAEGDAAEGIPVKEEPAGESVSLLRIRTAPQVHAQLTFSAPTFQANRLSTASALFCESFRLLEMHR